jgi:hypothetical protein
MAIERKAGAVTAPWGGLYPAAAALDGKNDTSKEIVKLKSQGAAADRLIELARSRNLRLAT